MTSTRVTLAFVKVNVSARDSLPPGAKINPTDPLTSAGCTNRSPRESARNCFAHLAAPLISRALPTSDGGASMRAAASMRTTASGSSTARRPSRSPARAALRNASTSFALTIPAGVRWCRRTAHAPARAARQLLCRVRRPSHDGPDLVERHGEQIMQDERQAFGGRQRVEHDEQRHADRVREHRFAFGIGAFPAHDARLGALRANRLSRRDFRERSMSRHTRETTVVNQPPRFSTVAESMRLSRSHASCTASSASLSEPSMR
jgi:hypothetical protein